MLYADPRVRERYVERRKFLLIFLERKDLSSRVKWDPRERYLPGKLPEPAASALPEAPPGPS